MAVPDGDDEAGRLVARWCPPGGGGVVRIL